MEPFAYTAPESSPGLFMLTPFMTRFPRLTAGMTARTGGVSEEPYGTLNCGLHVGDRSEAVITNRERVAGALGTELSSWVYGEQVHGNRVAILGPAELGRGTRERETELPATDAFITRTPGLILAALFADCVPLYFYDPVHEAVGLAHAGWKGTAARIAARTVEAMEQAFGTNPADLLAAIGPSIGSCCYEVDEGVLGPIREALGMTREALAACESNPLYEEREDGKARLDLQQVNRQIMIKAGILPASIEVTERCTQCSPDLLFSYRRDGGRTGRMQAWIGLLPEGGSSNH
ncbi:peptidoglycan editing factor PgeF [Gorillibacterium sp. CAU 1737]|uniref:peptidoglycan editing factor PgeF n=1 Tax=Gorillibacterium sp. CAU 1737 TaxID=3140362 RepID=UPI0032619C0C